MHRIFLSAMLLLPAAGIAWEQGAIVSATMLTVGNWSSNPSLRPSRKEGRIRP